MNIKDLIVSVVLALGITMLFQYFFVGNKESHTSVERVRVAPKTDVHRPLNIEIDFWDKQSDIKPVVTELETDFARFSFSSVGGALVGTDFKHAVDKSSTIWIPGIKAKGREDSSFLIAFDEKTPYQFNLVNKTEIDGGTKLEYRADFDGGILTKIFTVYKHKPQIDLNISIDPKGEVKDPYRLRLIYAVPSMLQAATKDEINKLQIREDDLFGILDSHGSVVKKPIQNLADKYWEVPATFGGIDKYFVTTMVNNSDEFAQRGYYNVDGQNSLKVFLEGPDVTEKSSWNLSFYVGPKKSSEFALVDSSLDNVLDYGLLAPLSKVLLRVLNFFNDYVDNFGWALILLTILIKIITLPLSLRGEQSTKKIAEMQRKLEYVQQKYRDNPEAMARARAEVVQKYGMSGMGGCLIPILVQFPVFIALRGILTTSLELYMAPFLWMSNLAAADPYYILPILVGGCLFVQTSANSADPRKKLSSLAFAILLSAMFSGFAAGISLFFFVSSLLNIMQTTLYKKFKTA